LSDCSFIKKGEDLFITGSTGTGYAKQLIM
jgi:hypothetical protein